MKRWLSNSLVVCALGTALSPDPARACGGTFCDTGPTAMPVDQTGENILFVMGDGIVEAHVQIQYQGDPERFAWIVPMQRVPDVTVGSEALFQRLLDTTVPSYGFSTQRDQCGNDGVSLSSASNSRDGAFADGGAASEGVNVVFEKSVGSYEVTALSGGTADEVTTWLEDNDYQSIDTAPDILQRYLDKDFVFVALKLQAGAGIDEIHPLVFSYEGGEACVPLELTAVAAIEDMGVRTFFLGNDRVVPTTYRHVQVNPLKIDWLNLGANYREVISGAVDLEGADGRAFVTEYAGPTSIAQTGQPLARPQWDTNRLAQASAENVVDELVQQGLVQFCEGDQCQYGHPLMQPLLNEHLRVPIGVPSGDFYACVSCYADQTDLSAFDAAAFAATVEERIVEPALHADELLADNPYLTRMFTLISPDEMIEDPLFREEPDLDDVPLPGTASRRIRCDGVSIFTLPDGQQVALDEDGNWPSFDDMPEAVTIESYAMPGEPETLSTFSSDIDEQLAAHNERHGLGDSGGCGCRLGTRRGSASGAGLGLSLLLLSFAVRRRRIVGSLRRKRR